MNSMKNAVLFALIGTIAACQGNERDTNSDLDMRVTDGNLIIDYDHAELGSMEMIFAAGVDVRATSSEVGVILDLKNMNAPLSSRIYLETFLERLRPLTNEFPSDLGWKVELLARVFLDDIPWDKPEFASSEFDDIAYSTSCLDASVDQYMQCCVNEGGCGWRHPINTTACDLEADVYFLLCQLPV